MQILFMSNLYPKENEDEIRSKMRFNMYDAANVLQWNIINGLVENNVEHLSLVNLLPVDSWPQYFKDPFIKEIKFGEDKSFKGISVKFCNVKYIKRFFIWKSFKKEIKKWQKETKNDNHRIVILYSLQSVFMKSVEKLKKLDKNIKVFAIVADLPEFSASSNSIIRKITLKCGINNKLDLIDGYVLLTRQMSDKLNIKKPYIVVEGIAPQANDELSVLKEKNSDKKTILYSGSMNIKYGIATLLDAFSKIKDENYELVLCGLGNAEGEIKKHCELDKRINYLGKVPRDEVLEMQRKATVLINPRQNNEEFTKYSFPSKNLEYLSSGVPLIAYKLDGIPDEYDDYIMYPESNSIEDLANCIERICSLSEEDRKQIGDKAKKFVSENKNYIVQTKKIIDLINSEN